MLMLPIPAKIRLTFKHTIFVEAPRNDGLLWACLKAKGVSFTDSPLRAGCLLEMTGLLGGNRENEGFYFAQGRIGRGWRGLELEIGLGAMIR